jgi:predicted nucleotide-binding protein
VRPYERLQLTKAIATALAGRPDKEVDDILRACDSAVLTPIGWGSGSSEQKIAGIEFILRRMGDKLLDEISDFVPPEQLPVIAGRLRGRTPPWVSEANTATPTASEPARAGDIFVVHGHAKGILHETVRVLERVTGREVVVLHEQPNAGRTIIEKFEHHAVGASFAVVLLTGDDQGGAKSANTTALRGRQNVIFELGFFFGKLGRNRIAVLLELGVEKPSDIDGLVYIELDQHGTWKQALARELDVAGIAVDRSRIP